VHIRHGGASTGLVHKEAHGLVADDIFLVAEGS
jgi:hypothetical protein